MAWQPRGMFIAGNPELADYVRYLEEELQGISAELAEIRQGRARMIENVAPAKPRLGQIVLADGTNWDPAVGATGYIWMADPDGEQWVPILLNGGRGDFGWDDELGELTLTNPSNDPKSKVLIGGIYALAFEDHPVAGNEDGVGLNLHIRHSYAEGTKIYPHIHWTSLSTGTVRWGFEFSAAKGHGQEVFGATQTVYVEQAITTPLTHMIAEVSDADAIAATHLEPDSVVLMRVFRNSSHANDTLAADAFGFKADVHFQRGRQVATKNKAPNFYSG